VKPVSASLPFALEAGGVLERAPRLVLEDGAVFACLDESGVLPALLTVAWLPEPPGATLEDVVSEELARLDAEGVLVDYEPVLLGGVGAVRTLSVHRDPSGRPAASEQWRLLACGRRWTLSALSALSDQPTYGPRLAAVASSLRITG